jgi:hypothetical protein
MVAAAALVSSALAGAAAAQSPNAAGQSALLSKPPREWVKDTAANEMVALYHKGSYLRYRMHVVNAKGDQVRDVIESRDGTVARTILRDGKPLTEEQDQGERQRLSDMVASPMAYAKHVKNSESERKLADRLVPLMPDAMLYSYVPGQPQTGTDAGIDPGSIQVVIDYKPNPKFVPPTTEAQALTGLEGRVWIDAKTRYLVRMEGRISRPVNFGWGMLAHLYPGGVLALKQTNAGGGRWIYTDFSMQLKVRALLVKTLSVDSHVQASNFETMPPMSYQDAIHLLLNP